jgi:hypothetical protein
MDTKKVPVPAASPVQQKRQEINSSCSPHSSAVSLDREDASRSALPALISSAPAGVTSTCSVEDWKLLLLPNLHCRHVFDKTHCHGRSISAVPDLGHINSTPHKSDAIAIAPTDQNRPQATQVPAEPVVKKGIKSIVKTRGQEKKRVRFHEEAYIREFPLIVGDVVTPNYDGCSNCGIPLSLGWEFEEKRSVLANDATTSIMLSRTVEELMLTAKERVEKLKKCGGYTDRQLWKVQRDLTLRDRVLFFSGIQE